MTITAVFGALLSAAALTQSSSAVDDLLGLAEQRADSALVAAVAQWPDEAREAVRQLLVLAVSPGEREEHVLSAERVGTAFAAAWQDSFVLRQVARFRRRSASERRRYVAADSVRREGNAAVYRDGVDVAMRHWRESLLLFTELGDSAGIASALGNLGAGFYIGGTLDSASVYLERARLWGELAGDLRVAGNAVVTLGSVAKQRGDLRRARESYQRALELHQQVGNYRGVAADHNNLGLIARDLGDRDGARSAYESALALNRRHGDMTRAADNLINLGNLAGTEGDYPAAASWYRGALGIYRDLDEPVNAALALYNLGLLDMRRGDYPGARTALGDALQIYDETGATSEAISARRSLANVHAAMGDLQTALEELTRAEDAAGAEAAASAALLADLALARADLAVRFNLLGDAEQAYGSAVRLYREANDVGGQGEAQQGRGVLLLLREDFAAARRALESALSAQETVRENPRSAAWTRVLLASAREELGDSIAARESLEEAVDALARLDDPVTEAAALSALGDLEAKMGMTLAAESQYHRALRLVENRPAPSVAWRLHAGLGRALASRGALPQAAREFRAAIGQIERVSGALTLEDRRAAFLADKWDVYGDLALLQQRLGDYDAAFEVSERMRARQMLDLLARGRISGGASAPTDLTAREQNLRRRITELTKMLEGYEGGALRGPNIAARDLGIVREGLADAQQRYAELLLDIRQRSPEYATMVTGEVATVRDIMTRLTPDQALLEFLLSDSTSVVFVATADTVVALDLNTSRGAIAGLVDFVRGVLVRPEEGATSRDLWRAPLRQLYRRLIQPVEDAGLLRGKQRLLIAPHAELHYLPFDALVVSDDPGRFLIEQYEVTYVPSASVWARLGERRPRRSGGVERVLALAPRDRVLPGSREEVEAIGRIFSDRATVLIGSDATESVLHRSTSQYDVIHLASYGILNKHNPLFSFVELNAGGDHDGRLEVHEVFGLDLNARLVVLSACQTGLGSGALADVPAGDDWVGLVRAFLYAGASNVLATIWPVEDEATAILMERFYRQLESGNTPSEAIALAKRESLSDRDMADPFYWAGFVLVGSQ